MNDSLSPQQCLALFWLLFTNITLPPLQSKIKPKLSRDKRAELVTMGLIRLEPRAKGRGKQVELTDKAWEWASENLESKLWVGERAAPALEALHAVLGQLSGFLRARSLHLSDFFHPSAELQPNPTSPHSSVEDDIRRAYLQLSGQRFGQMVRLADLKHELPDVLSHAVDEALLAMQKNGDVSLQTIESMQQTTEADRRAAIRILGEDRNLVYLEK